MMAIGFFKKPNVEVVEKPKEIAPINLEEKIWIEGYKIVRPNRTGYNDFKFELNTNNDYTASNLYVGKTAAFLMPALMLIIYVAQFTIYMIGGNSILEAFKGAIKVDDMINVSVKNGSINAKVVEVNDGK